MAIQYSNNRIAKNTVFMYVRLFVTLIISLYISRVVLDVLGVSDYGLYNVVGGVLAMFTFISSSLGAATSRFLNIEMGKQGGDVNKIFNINVVLHVALAIIILILAETIGLWYIYNKLNVAPGKLPDAIFVYQVSIITSCIGIINSPYSSVFSAHEKFAFLTGVDLFNIVLRLGCVIAMQYYRGNALRFFSIIMCITTASSFVFYHIFSHRWWPETVKIALYRSKTKYKEVLSYGGWNLLDTISMMVRNSGSDLILNRFFGTSLNGAFSISKQIGTQVINFSSIITSTSSPQITQSYAAGDMQRCTYLVNKMGRFNLLLFELMLFPLFVELDLLLHVWLKEVPDQVLIFSQLNLVAAFIAVSCGGISNLIAASDKLKWFKIPYSIIILGCLPVLFVLFKTGAAAHLIVIVFMVADAIQRIIQLFLLKRLLGFDSIRFVREAYLRPIVIALIMSAIVFLYSLLNVQVLLVRILAIAVCGIVTATLVFFYGITKGERKRVCGFVKRRLKL